MFKFERLSVWCKAMDYFDYIDCILEKVNKRYRFSLVDQMIRATLPVSNNIAEASGRSSKNEQSYFFNIAKGSIYETVNMCL
ncbi:MAG: four helix bundle protein [bacterium]|nr:four helix bundle protein [bacterium]